MAITRVQTFTVATKSNGTGSSVTNTLTSVPTAGNLLVAFLTAGDGGGAPVISSFDDNIGDSVSWTPFASNPVTFPGGGNTKYNAYWKVVGTPSGGLKAVTATITATQALALYVGEYGVDSGSPTWSITGTPVSATGLVAGAPADAGDIATTIADAVLIGIAGSSSNQWLVGSGYTIQASASVWEKSNVQDKIVSATGTYAVDWTNPVSPGDWAAIGIAFGATVGGSTVTEGSRRKRTVFRPGDKGTFSFGLGRFFKSRRANANNAPAPAVDTALVLQDASHTHTADNVVLTTATTLVVNNATHAHASQNLNFGGRILDILLAYRRRGRR